jgi:flagellar motor switch protein FliG
MGPDEGIEKSAMLLLSLGEDAAAEVLKHLGPREVQKLGHAMASKIGRASCRERVS